MDRPIEEVFGVPRALFDDLADPSCVLGLLERELGEHRLALQADKLGSLYLFA